MADLNKHITGLNTKLQQLLKQYAALQSETKNQKEIIAALKASDKEQKETIAALHRQVLILKTSLGNTDGKEKKELEQKINGYLRNIDKCISLLSHKQNV